MSNLFTDLYAYRQREHKDPLEDWLTECLAATLRALPARAKVQLLSHWSGSSIGDPDAFTAKHKVEIVTQCVAGAAGRPDMVIWLDEHPWILFENKVAHGVGIREDADGGSSHQLRSYSDWLATEGEGCPFPKAMMFVTHITSPPADFLSQSADQRYHGQKRTSTSWGALCRQISRLTADEPETSHAKALTKALASYLEDQDMTNEFPDAAGFAVAELYVTQAGALENLVDRMWREVKGVASFGKTADYRLCAIPDDASISAWRYVAPGPKSLSRDSCIQTGIWFPESGQWYGQEALGVELRGAHAYIIFANDSDDAFCHLPDQPEGFLRPDSNFLAVAPIREFSSNPQARGEEIIAWVAEKASALSEYLKAHGVVS